MCLRCVFVHLLVCVGRILVVSISMGLQCGVGVQVGLYVYL